jgi:hypothetical protein
MESRFRGTGNRDLPAARCQYGHGEPRTRSLGTSTWQVQVARLNTVTQATRLRLVAYFAYFAYVNM